MNLVSSPELPAASRWQMVQLPAPCPPPLLQALASWLAQSPPPRLMAGTPRSTPAELLRARLLGLPDADGQVPWAALRALQRGLDPAQSWGFVHPCHWALGADHTRLEDPSTLALDEAASRALLDAMHPYFAGDGLTLEFDTPARWLVHGEPLRGLRCTSLARAIGQDVAGVQADTAGGTSARWLLRLQSEMQMLLYQHPLHDARKAQGLAPVNSFWLDGTGTWPAGLAPRTPQIEEPALGTDPLALPAMLNAITGATTAIAVCGARGAALFVPQADPPASWTQRLRGMLSFPSRGARERELLTLLQDL
ncbi:MAG: phosphoglycerate mutase [Betaproteobacteria bacterium]|nr:phosphoglycerate mutase [Betaproteobacteria bacterium]